MRTVNIVMIGGILMMLAVIVWAAASGDMLMEGGMIWNAAWGKVTLLDLYTGFGLFSGWILFRERRVLFAVPWVVGLMVLGNLLAMVYVLSALYRSGGSPARFWMGDRVTHA